MNDYKYKFNKIMDAINFDLKRKCSYALSLICVLFWGCSESVLIDELNVMEDVENIQTRTTLSDSDIYSVDTVLIDNVPYVSIEGGLNVQFTVRCVVRAATTNLCVKLSYPTINQRGYLRYKEAEEYYNFGFYGTNIFDWCKPIVSIVEEPLYIAEKVYVPLDNSDIDLYLDMTASGAPAWTGKSACIWMRYYTHKDYTYKYFKMENSEADPNYYKGRLAVPFNYDDANWYIEIGDARITDSYGTWGPTTGYLE